MPLGDKATLTQHLLALQDITNVSPWSQITAQFNLFNSGSSSSSSPAASTAGRRLLQKPDHLAQAAAMQAADGGHNVSSSRSLLQANSSGNSSYADYEAADTTTSDLTKEGEVCLYDPDDSLDVWLHLNAFVHGHSALHSHTLGLPTSCGIGPVALK